MSRMFAVVSALPGINGNAAFSQVEALSGLPVGWPRKVRHVR